MPRLTGGEGEVIVGVGRGDALPVLPVIESLAAPAEGGTEMDSQGRKVVVCDNGTGVSREKPPGTRWALVVTTLLCVSSSVAICSAHIPGCCPCHYV